MIFIFNVQLKYVNIYRFSKINLLDKWIKICVMTLILGDIAQQSKTFSKTPTNHQGNSHITPQTHKIKHTAHKRYTFYTSS